MQITAETPFKASIVPLPLSNIAQGFSSLASTSARFLRQCTLNQSITCVGIGLHSGARVRMVLNPAPAGHGIVFKRSDLPQSRLIPARHDYVVCTRLSTVIAHPDAPEIRIATIEHLMAALHANGIDNALIEIDGPETPVLDGSAAEFDFLIQCAGTVALESARSVIEVLHPCASRMPVVPMPSCALPAREWLWPCRSILPLQ